MAVLGLEKIQLSFIFVVVLKHGYTPALFFLIYIIIYNNRSPLN